MPEAEEKQTEKSGRAPAIHTMKSDIQELVRETKPSFLEMVGQEVRRGQRQPSAPAKRKWFFVWLGAGVLILLLLAGGAWLFLAPKEEVALPKLIVPPPPFAAETSRTITVGAEDRTLFFRLMQDAAQEFEIPKTFKRLVIKLQEGGKERLMELDDLWRFYRITPPVNLSAVAGTPLMTFFYQSERELRFGWAVRVRDQERAFAEILKWEPSLLTDFRPFFFNETPESVLAPFEDRVYRNISWRFLKLSPTGDLGIAYGIFPARDLLVFTTSKESFEAVINRLFEAR